MSKLPKEEQKKHLVDLLNACPNNKIGMIKVVRSLKPGLGLAEAKDLVETCMSQASSAQGVYEKIKYALGDVLTPEFSKEQFLSLLGSMIEHAEIYYMDPLEAVLHGCKKLQDKGGLTYAAQKDEKLIDSI